MIRGRHTVVLVGLVLAVVFVATGCGGSDSETSAATTQATTETSETQSEEEQGDLANDTPQSAARPAAQLINRYLFRTKSNHHVCGLDGSNLVCIVTASGATVTLPPRGRPRVKVEAENRGVPPRARSSPVLKKGQVVTRGAFRCSLRKGEVRCTNRNRHGFLLGANSIFRF